MNLINYAYAERLKENEDTDLLEFLQGIETYLLTVVAALFILFIIIGGYQMITSAGNPEKVKKGKKTLIFSVVGLVAILLAKIIFNLISGDIMDNIFGTGTYDI